MAKTTIDYREHFQAVMNVLTDRGLLLASRDVTGRLNPMTIGWGMLGSVWGIPMWQVLVRPSRYTYQCIEHTGDFTVNVPPRSLDGACALCGSHSGRDKDKMAECGLTVAPPGEITSRGIADCAIVYDCRVVHYNDVQPPALAERIAASAYASGDYHRIFWGQILAVRADAKLLAEL